MGMGFKKNILVKAVKASKTTYLRFIIHTHKKKKHVENTKNAFIFPSLVQCLAPRKVLWCLNLASFGPLVPWSLGPLVLWSSGPLVLPSFGDSGALK